MVQTVSFMWSGSPGTYARRQLVGAVQERRTSRHGVAQILVKADLLNLAIWVNADACTPVQACAPARPLTSIPARVSPPASGLFAALTPLSAGDVALDAEVGAWLATFDEPLAPLSNLTTGRGRFMMRTIAAEAVCLKLGLLTVAECEARAKARYAGEDVEPIWSLFAPARPKNKKTAYTAEAMQTA